MTAVKRGSTNKNQTGQAWDAENGTQNIAGIEGLDDLFSSLSMTSDNRNVVEVTQVLEVLRKNYEQMNSSTTPRAQLAILPSVDPLTPSISAVLPGIVFHRIIGKAYWVQGVLFANKDITIASEPIRMNNGIGGSSQISIPVTPTQYANEQVQGALKAHFLALGESEGIREVNIINLVVQDMEMLNHGEAGDAKDRVSKIASYLAGQWENAVMVKATSLFPKAGRPIPSPWKDAKEPFGKDGYAEARVNAVQDRVTRGHTLSPANMEVVLATINNLNSSASIQANSKEIVRTMATVSLCGLPYNAHIANLAANRGNASSVEAMQALIGGGGLFPNNYRPLMPVITLESAAAGEMLNYNQGVIPYLVGLWTLMATNADHVFTEALRRLNVGSRGNLVDLEARVDQLLQGVYAGPRTILDSKSITDTDVMNQWIRQNVASNAMFRSNLLTNGVDAPINNWLLALSSEDSAEAKATLIAAMDAVTKNKFSEILVRNKEAKTGWTPDKVALHRTQTLVVNGLAKSAAGKEHSTLEVDEMLLGHVKGPKGLQQVLNYLQIQYGATDDQYKARCQKIRMELNQSVYDGNVHINSFAQSCIWDPLLMAAIGESMKGLGTLTVANSMASFRPQQAVFMAGGGLATSYSVGSNVGAGGMGAFIGGGLFG